MFPPWLDATSTSSSALTRSRGRDNQPKSFEDLGLHPPIISSLRDAFPNITYPTLAQEKLIPAVLNDSDVLLQDETGSGKPFGLVLALLNKPKSPKAPITSIFITPHRDLAWQFQHWVRRLFKSTTSIGSITQVLVRDNDRSSGLLSLKNNPPHLLFATPQALMDIWREEPDALRLDTLSCIVVDEADYLIDTVDSSSSRKHNLARRRPPKRQQHPRDTQEFLNIVYGHNMRHSTDEYTPLERDRSPQLIVSSATLPSHLVEYVTEESSWLNRDNWVVFEDNVRNIAGAVPPASSSELHPLSADHASDDDLALEADSALAKKYAQTASPFNPLSLETIAMLFALDVPSIALLVIPSSLSWLGVNAHGLDLLKDRLPGRGTVRENPTLVISTWANTRGLDVPDLTHVFLLGLPDDATGGVNAYVHIAGRQKRSGKVIVLVESGEEEAARHILKSINRVPTAIIEL
ncbi:P-loop containing nucleoside triphosphate hydrolase protein [Mycena rebaudengoi]|nr:P-loop containing nucleoside triphosphate hydrolase protein [Mycena rebaudengoi]